MKDCDLERALTCLSSSFRLVCDSESERDLALVQSVVQKATGSEPPSDRKLCKSPPSHVVWSVVGENQQVQHVF